MAKLHGHRLCRKNTEFKTLYVNGLLWKFFDKDSAETTFWRNGQNSWSYFLLKKHIPFVILEIFLKNRCTDFIRMIGLNLVKNYPVCRFFGSQYLDAILRMSQVKWFLLFVISMIILQKRISSTPLEEKRLT